MFVDVSLRDYAVYPELSRLYLTHLSLGSTTESSRKMSVIQDTSWSPQWVFLPVILVNK